MKKLALLLMMLGISFPAFSNEPEFCSVENGQSLVFQADFYNSLLKGPLVYQDDNLLKQVTESLDKAVTALEIFLDVCGADYD